MQSLALTHTKPPHSHTGMRVKQGGLRTPTVDRSIKAHCIPMTASGQLCSDLWPNPSSAAHGTGQRPKGKGQGPETKRKPDQLIHGKSFQELLDGWTDRYRRAGAISCVCVSPSCTHALTKIHKLPDCFTMDAVKPTVFIKAFRVCLHCN